jgi:hypothetical protein
VIVTGTLHVAVESYAGHRGEETPRRFRIGDRWIGVAEVLDRWLAPDHRYFEVRGDDHDRYVLRHDAASDVWELRRFEQGRQ